MHKETIVVSFYEREERDSPCYNIQIVLTQTSGDKIVNIVCTSEHTDTVYHGSGGFFTLLNALSDKGLKTYVDDLSKIKMITGLILSDLCF